MAFNIIRLNSSPTGLFLFSNRYHLRAKLEAYIYDFHSNAKRGFQIKMYLVLH